MWRICAFCLVSFLHAEEFPEAVEEDALSLVRLEGLFTLLDSHPADGLVTWSELVTFAAAARHGLAEKDIVTAMEEMDQNGDGFVTFDELHGAEAEAIDEEDRNEMEQRMAEDRQLFAAADEDQDGRLTPMELRQVLYPETHEAVLRLVAEHSLRRKDLDGDGQLSMAEFWEGDMATGNDENGEETTTFQTLDKDGNGYLSVVELMHWESGVHHTEVAFKELLRLCDSDNNGALSLEELTAQHQQLAHTDAAYHFLEWAEHHEL